MKTFEEKLEEYSLIFSNSLNKFNDETSVPILDILTRQIYLTDEFKKKETHIKLAC